MSSVPITELKNNYDKMSTMLATL